MMKKKEKNSFGGLALSDRIFYIFCNAFVAICAVVALYPMIFMVASSLSSANAISSGKVFLWPVEPTIEGFRLVFKTKEIITGYRNTIFYTAAATVLNVMFNMMVIYPLARKNFYGRNLFMLFIYIPGVLSGGMIPAYILYTKLHMVNTIWMMIIPGLFSTYFILVGKAMLADALPEEVLEAAKIDGCSDFRYFFEMVLPLSKALVAIIAFNSAMGHWNNYMTPMIYIHDESKYPLQLVLRNILIKNTVNSNMLMDLTSEDAMLKKNATELLKYSSIVVSILPLLCLLPFMQKYFIRGTLTGAVKG